MNEHLLHELPATYPQHERRIVAWNRDDESGLFSYCTLCAWDSDNIKDWVLHLEAVTKEHFAGVIERDRLSPQPKDGDLIPTTQYTADGVPGTTVERYGDETGKTLLELDEIDRKDYADTELDPEGNPV